MFSIILQTARSTLKSLICVFHFSKNFNSVFHKKGFMKLSGALPIYHTKEKEQILYIIRIFTFNDKNPLYLPIILTLHFLRVKVIKQ